MKEAFFKRSATLLPIVIVAWVTAATSFATAIGPLNIANCSSGGFTITNTTITWAPAGTVPGTGCVDTGAGTNVTYSGGTLASADAGDIKNLVAGGGTVDQFMTFQGTTLDFVLTALGPGVVNTTCTGLAVLGTCSVFSGSPFVLTNLGSGNSKLELDASGTIMDGGQLSTWSGSFMTQLSLTPDQIQTILAANGSVTTTISGEFTVTAPVPEPSTIYLLLFGGVGLFGMARILRRG